MKIASGVPGNLFIEGRPVEMRVDGASSPVRWELLDFRGSTRLSGEAKDGGIHLGELPPGWYRVRISGADACLGVLMRGSGGELPADGRVCADSAASELVDRARWREFVAIVRRAGIPWVRERLRWSKVEREEGKPDWSRLREISALYRTEGIRICQAWHDVPAWARPARPDSPGADDLRRIYRFAREAAAEFREEVQAWEIWNEPDIFFWKDSSARYAGLLRAAARGFRDGNPDAIVLPGALCSGETGFAARLFATGALDECDRFNWHLYKTPEEYPAELDGYRRLATASGKPLKAAWMTEAGIRLRGLEGEGSRLLDAAGLRDQARFVPRSVVMSLAAGDERHFFFILSSYLENGTQYGALLPDLTPAPALCALSAAANILGISDCLGQLPAKGGQAWAFRTPNGTVVAAWGDEPGEIEVPAGSSEGELLDIFGASRPIAAGNGAFRFPIGPEAVYLRFRGELPLDRLARRAPPPGETRRGSSPAIAIAVRLDAPFDKDRDAFKTDGTGLSGEVELCNLAATARAKGAVTIDVPPGWRADAGSLPFDLEPMGRLVSGIRLTPGAASLATFTLTATARSGGGAAASSVAAVQFDVALFHEAGSHPLDWARAGQWTPLGPAGSRLSFTQEAPGAVAVSARRPGRGDWWLEAALKPGAPVDLEGWDAIGCELTGTAPDSDQELFIMVDEPDGSVRMTGGKVEAGNREVRFLFRDLGLTGRMASRVRIGVWTSASEVGFTMARFRLVRLEFRKAAAR